MKNSIGLLLLFAAAICSSAKDRRTAPSPQQFEIGRQTFFDFGPPTDYYDIFLVRNTQNGSSVTKISVTPPAGACLKPTVTSRTGMLPEAVAELLQPNPCAISEKELRRQPKRCKKCLVFSGAIVNLDVHCGESNRLIRSDILDRDWFAEKPDTPNQTRKTMQLLEKLEAVTGPGPLDRPVFETGSTQSGALRDEQTAQALLDGRFDPLFPGNPQKVSDLYRDSLKPQKSPEAVVVSVSPTDPSTMVPPSYPPIAKAAHIEGDVEVRFEVDESGQVVDPVSATGHPMLKSAAEQLVRVWRFPPGPRQHAKTTISYKLNCPPSDVQR